MAPSNSGVRRETTTTICDAPAAISRRAWNSINVTPPTGSVALASGRSATNQSTPVFKVTAKDNRKVTQMRVGEGDVTTAPWVSYRSTVAVPLSPGEGPKAVSAQFRDAAGNTSAVTVTSVVYDVTPPAVRFTAPAEGASLDLSTVMRYRLAGTQSDSGSGVETARAQVKKVIAEVTRPGWTSLKRQ